MRGSGTLATRSRFISLSFFVTASSRRDTASSREPTSSSLSMSSCAFT